MFAFATARRIEATRETGRATFWSRSRGELWEKGRTSGNAIASLRVLVDCDADCVIYSSEPHGNSCHTGAQSCFFQVLGRGRAARRSSRRRRPPQTLLATLESVLEARKQSTGAGELHEEPLRRGRTAIGGQAPRRGGRAAAGHRVRERRPRRQRSGRRPLPPDGGAPLVGASRASRPRRAGAPLGTSGHEEKASRRPPSDAVTSDAVASRSRAGARGERRATR